MINEVEVLRPTKMNVTPTPLHGGERGGKREREKGEGKKKKKKMIKN